MLEIFALLVIIAQVLPTEIIALLAPIVVYAVTYVVKWALPKIPGWTIVSIVVPGLSVLAAFIATLLVPGLSFLIQVVLGLLAVFVANLIKQFGEINKG